MRKHVAKYSAILAAFAVLATGCSGGDEADTDALIGRWSWSKLVVNGVTWSPNNPEVFTPGGSTTITPATVTQLGATVNVAVVFNEDKTVDGSVNATVPGFGSIAESGQGTWSVSGDKLTVRFTNAGQNFTLAGVYSVSGSRLTIAMSNQQLLELLDVNDLDLSELTPAQRDLVRTLSGTVEFTR